jgi:hypothetical protein
MLSDEAVLDSLDLDFDLDTDSFYFCLVLSGLLVFLLLLFLIEGLYFLLVSLL